MKNWKDIYCQGCREKIGQPFTYTTLSWIIATEEKREKDHSFDKGGKSNNLQVHVKKQFHNKIRWTGTGCKVQYQLGNCNDIIIIMTITTTTNSTTITMTTIIITIVINDNNNNNDNNTIMTTMITITMTTMTITHNNNNNNNKNIVTRKIMTKRLFSIFGLKVLIA